MIIRKYREIDFESDKFKKDDLPPLESCSDNECPIDKKALMIRRSLNVQIKNDDVK
jgi:hypothetical protein